eukprot:m.201535 g.201535  ORF g.201535 m.201535 type:complete len:125 (+) comp53830_c0_seq3:1244-1618(+)
MPRRVQRSLLGFFVSDFPLSVSVSLRDSDFFPVVCRYPGIVRALSAPLTYSFMFFRCVCYPVFYSPFVYEVFFNPPNFPGRMQEVYFVTFSITGVLIGGFEWSRSLYIGYKRMLHKENKSAKTH